MKVFHWDAMNFDRSSWIKRQLGLRKETGCIK